MKYTKFGYKFITRENLEFKLINSFPDVDFDWCSIKDGVLKVKENYAWDGASGPVFNTKNSLVGTMVHDCLCQLMRLNILPVEYREAADKEFHNLLKQYGMSRVRAFIWYLAVRAFGKKSATERDARDFILSVEEPMKVVLARHLKDGMD